jgi:hypothetical protein
MRTPLKAVMILLVSMVALQSRAQQSTVFGLHLLEGTLNSQPWPTVPVSTMRLWNTGTSWTELESSNGVYNWTALDQWMTAAQSKGLSDLLYTFGRTPNWISSDPSDGSCSFGPGQCWPPSDLNSDGSGTDQSWKDFVSALTARNAANGFPIRYWEAWNEFDQPGTWKGTLPQLVRMAQDARTIILASDSTAVMLTPSSSTGLTATATRMKAYLATPGASAAADAIAIHPYVQLGGGVAPIAEDVVTLIQNVKNALGPADAAKPLWGTEGSWGLTNVSSFNDVDQQAAFTARYLILQQSMGMARFYWYQWNSTIDGTLWTSSGITPVGTAYGEVEKWLGGKVMTQPCSAHGTVWTCGFASNLLVWDASQRCLGRGACSNSNYSVSGPYTQIARVDGTTAAIAGGCRSGCTIAIGAKPILLTGLNSPTSLTARIK